MAVKDFLTKLLIGSDIHEDLLASEREMRETQDKYISARNTNEALENECSSLDKSVNLLTQEVKTLKDEQKSLDDYLNQFLKDEERNDAHTVLIKKLERKTKIDNLVVQRKGIRDNLTVLKDEWQNTLDEFKTRLADVDSQKSLNELKYELKDYERRINNAIEISVE